MNDIAINASWRFDSQLEVGHEAAARIREIAERLRFPEAELARIELCVYEAFVNAVEHAYQTQPGHEVEVKASTADAHLRILVCQRGIPLDAATIEATPSGFDDQHDPLDAFACEHRGRGIRIIKSIVSSCSVEHTGDQYCLAMSLPLP